jgi:uncharacterized protein
MRITCDPRKDKLNIAKHGISLNKTSELDFDTAIVMQDNRHNYGEKRYNATGLIGNRLYVLTFTQRGKGIRVISLRKANMRERKKYDQKIH